MKLNRLQLRLVKFLTQTKNSVDRRTIMSELNWSEEQLTGVLNSLRGRNILESNTQQTTFHLARSKKREYKNIFTTTNIDWRAEITNPDTLLKELIPNELLSKIDR